VFRTHIYTVCADVWAYGVLVWEIFNNAVEPYKGWNGTQVKMEVLKGYRLKMPDWAPPKIKQICERAWNDDMYTRPTLDEIANELLIGTGRNVGGEAAVKSASTFLTRPSESDFDTDSYDGDSRGSRECRSRERFRRRRIRRRQ
uniref:Protein kinase domain-containing protein n=1 Tax=Parascaris equorum TaxID=6256 RepID=A0A914R4L9_PAREQ